MTFQASIPNASDLISVSQSDIKNNFTALNTSWNVNHVGFNASGAGKHNFVEFPNQSSNPAGAATEMTLFSKLDGGSASQLFYKRDNAGTAYQITGRDPAGTTSGTTFLPGGFLLIWGLVTGATNNSTKSFHTAFPNNCFHVQLTNKQGGGGVFPITLGVTSFSQSSFVVKVASSLADVYYLAIGN